MKKATPTPRQLFVQNLRRSQNISQEVLALKAGMSRAIVNAVKREIRNISIDIESFCPKPPNVLIKDLLDPSALSQIKHAEP